MKVKSLVPCSCSHQIAGKYGCVCNGKNDPINGTAHPHIGQTKDSNRQKTICVAYALGKTAEVYHGSVSREIFALSFRGVVLSSRTCSFWI